MAATTHTYTVDAQVASGGEASVAPKGRKILFDGSAEQGDELPGPADLLIAAFAACAMKNVERFSHLLPFAYEQASITVRAERQDAPPKIIAVHYELRVTTNEPSKRVELLHDNIRRHGTIFNTLAAVCKVTGGIVTVPV
ncbi:MAG: OsmC family protein [Nitriliruptoraceae bacterium]